MRAFVFCVFSILLITLSGSAQTNATSSGTPREIPAFDINAIDKTIDPCVDFYQYSCGTWIKNNPVPPDKARWGRFDELAERNIYILRDILTAPVADRRSPVAEMVSTYYASCMDESAIEKKGIAPLVPELDRINGVKTKQETDCRDFQHAQKCDVGAVCVLSPTRYARLDRNHCVHRSRRDFAAGSRLLLKGRSEVGGDEAEICRARPEDVRTRRR